MRPTCSFLLKGHSNLPYTNLQQNNIESPISFNKKSQVEAKTAVNSNAYQTKMPEQFFQVSEFIPPSRLNSTSSPSFYTTYSNTTNIVNGSSTTPTKVYASSSYSVTPIKSTQRIFEFNYQKNKPFHLFSDRNYLGDSPQNISPKITPQESPPNIYSSAIHQVWFSSFLNKILWILSDKLKFPRKLFSISNIQGKIHFRFRSIIFTKNLFLFVFL